MLNQEKAGYRASKQKSTSFMNQRKWFGHEIDENRIKPKEIKVDTILKLNPPKNLKELKSFLGPIQYMAKLLPRLWGKNRLTPNTIEEKRNVELANRTKRRLPKDKTDVDRRPISSTLCKR